MTWKTPPLAECNPGIEPTEFMVLIAMSEKEERTAGGILLAPTHKDKEDWRASTARLVAVSPLAFTYANWPEGARKPQIGDVVFTGTFPGSEIEGADGRKYRLCQDREIGAVIERHQTAALRQVEETADAA